MDVEVGEKGVALTLTGPRERGIRPPRRIEAIRVVAPDGPAGSRFVAEVKPPFATATLARLYLSQGRHASAEAVARELRERGEPAQDVEEALARIREERSAALSDILRQVRERRRRQAD